MKRKRMRNVKGNLKKLGVLVLLVAMIGNAANVNASEKLCFGKNISASGNASAGPMSRFSTS